MTDKKSGFAGRFTKREVSKSVVSQEVKFSSIPQVDPEGQTAVREFKLAAAADMVGPASPSAALSGTVGNIPAIVQYSGTAGEMANAARTACAGCAHFDVKAWRRFVVNAEGPASSAESRQTLQTMRSRIMMAGYGYEDSNGELDVDATLKAHGICRVLSDWVESCVGRDPVFWPVVPWREATCPNTCRAGPHTLPVVTPAEPFGLYSPIDTDAVKVGANRYDTILKAVQNQNRR